jgi:hypothetical protein
LLLCRDTWQLRGGCPTRHVSYSPRFHSAATRRQLAVVAPAHKLNSLEGRWGRAADTLRASSDALLHDAAYLQHRLDVTLPALVEGMSLPCLPTRGAYRGGPVRAVPQRAHGNQPPACTRRGASLRFPPVRPVPVQTSRLLLQGTCSASHLWEAREVRSCVQMPPSCRMLFAPGKHNGRRRCHEGCPLQDCAPPAPAPRECTRAMRC